jgi:Ca2+-binding EF-hand superfamily protein
MQNSNKSLNILKRFYDSKRNILRELTATQFLCVWNNYDVDGNGYIDKNELEKFLINLVEISSKNKKKLVRQYILILKKHASTNNTLLLSLQDLSKDCIENLKVNFLNLYDKDLNGKITIDEMASILPVDESFLTLFEHENEVESISDFLKIWRKCDRDASGYIDKSELKEFIRSLLIQHKPNLIIKDEKLNDYSYALMTIYDKNHDGRLQFNEMLK